MNELTECCPVVIVDGLNGRSCTVDGGGVLVATYVPLNVMEPPEIRVRLCVAGVIYSGKVAHMIVYVPAGNDVIHPDGKDDEGPTPPNVMGPAIIQAP